MQHNAGFSISTIVKAACKKTLVCRDVFKNTVEVLASKEDGQETWNIV